MAFSKKCDKFGFLIEYHPRKRLSTTATVAVIPGTYRTIVIDPPWPIEKIERYERPYQEPTGPYELKEKVCQSFFPILSLL
jgi:hypothetical protein